MPPLVHGAFNSVEKARTALLKEIVDVKRYMRDINDYSKIRRLTIRTWLDAANWIHQEVSDVLILSWAIQLLRDTSVIW